jgi:hypothetical protein
MSYNRINYTGDSTSLNFAGPTIRGTVIYEIETDTFVINATTPNNHTIKYWAANPIWRNYSYSGSGLPYPNAEVAYEQTSNQGVVEANRNGDFTIKVTHPSEYYVKQGTVLLKPHIHLQLVDLNQIVTIRLGEYLPYRSLTSLPNRPDRSIGR